MKKHIHTVLLLLSMIVSLATTVYAVDNHVDSTTLALTISATTLVTLALATSGLPVLLIAVPAGIVFDSIRFLSGVQDARHETSDLSVRR